jgi:hypothetical protein
VRPMCQRQRDCPMPTKPIEKLKVQHDIRSENINFEVAYKSPVYGLFPNSCFFIDYSLGFGDELDFNHELQFSAIFLPQERIFITWSTLVGSVRSRRFDRISAIIRTSTDVELFNVASRDERKKNISGSVLNCTKVG